ncbi:MAG: DUF2304 domain-containing protein [Burkholderiales bacterium]
MVLSLRIFLIVVCTVFFAIVIIMLRREKLNLKYTLVWMLTSLVMLLFSIFPEIAVFISSLIGIIEPVNAVFLFAILFILLISFTLTIIITRLSARIKHLTQYTALLEEKVRNHIKE